MNNQRLHHTNLHIRVRKERTENMALNKLGYMATHFERFNYEHKIALFYLNDPLCIQTVYDFAADHSLRYLPKLYKKKNRLLILSS